ncbi:MAG: lysylphosphatidylglycerol synthase transmembrane domain-containing protein [Candidatus Moranbacteria bacterium]|nr:lysylphosphatidylglycerol synthase transmembrane domain-containing protein [Candidatus Moranbacteria bacterium]
MKKITKFIIKLAISLAFLFWLIFKINWQEVLALLSKIEIKYIVLYFIVLVAGILVSAYKWKKLAEFKGIHLPLRDFFKFYLAGTFINNFMPSFIGGDTFRAYQIGKAEKKYTQAASSVVVDRLTGLFGAMLLTLFFSLLNYRIISTKYILSVLNAGVLAGVIVVVLFFVTRKMQFWEKLALHKTKLGQYVPEKASKFMLEMAHYHDNSGVLWQAVAGSVAFSLIGLAGANFVLFLALGAKIGLLDYLSVIFLISIVSSAPISINNIGVKEWAYVTFFGFFGVSSALVITVAILSRFLQMLLSFLALPVYLKNK